MRSMFETMRSLMVNARRGTGPCDPFAIGPWDIASDIRDHDGGDVVREPAAMADPGVTATRPDRAD